MAKRKKRTRCKWIMIKGKRRKMCPRIVTVRGKRRKRMVLVKSRKGRKRSRRR